jgi:cell division transport system permease protein
MRSFFYFIKEALGNSKKNFGTAFGAVITIFLSLLVIGVFMVASLMIDRIVQTVEDQVSVTIFLSDDAEQADVTTLMNYAKSQPQVQDVVYISKEQALERFKEMSSSAAIAQQLDGNPLPASIELSLSDPEQVKVVVDAILSNSVLVKVADKPDDPSNSIRYGQDIVDQLFSFTTIVRYVCLVLVILLIFVALIFINNTIRLAILARRKEIAIMKLVGASNGFIRGPFLMEGAIQALVGAGLAIGVVALLCDQLLPRVSSFLNWLPIDLVTMQLWAVYLILLAVGLIIGLFGSAWAMRRYLKV